MKTALTSVLTATLLGIASLASGRQFDAATLTALIFAAGLVAWTVQQYSRQPKSLAVVRPIPFPVAVRTKPEKMRTARLAA